LAAVRGALVAIVAASLVGLSASDAVGAPRECETAGKVCLGTLPSSHKRVVLKSLNGSSERGIASVTLGFHETKVVFRLRGAPLGVRQTVRLLKGGCNGKLLTQLGTIVDGKGVARANPISHLSGYAIAVHASTASGATIVACGVVPRYVPKR
jgi:hypothetical protein